MNIYELVDNALSSLFLPYYYGVPELEEEPDEYLTYDLYETPGNYSDAGEQANEYTVTINVIAPRAEPGLYNKVKAAMKAAGFTYQSGLDITDDEIYPYKIQYAQEYMICMEV